jgi:hypothetical protein
MYQVWLKSVRQGLLGTYVKYTLLSIIFLAIISLSHPQVEPLNRISRLMTQTTQKKTLFGRGNYNTFYLLGLFFSPKILKFPIGLARNTEKYERFLAYLNE